ncbi:MAG TPA: tetratricopeptide repeat protein, partial [Blastocatellia bacterium]|nr:tetratricopeptide repeat protein [Blastocatellia bacterium]
WRDGANDPLTGYYLGLVHFREGRLRDAVSVCRRAIEANPGLCKAVSCHESSDGTATMTRAARRVSAELGAENLKDLRVILARAAGDAQWWPAHLSAVRAS